jgi:ubiquinone/menaquinone biosynthesis C-methylase UbiE
MDVDIDPRGTELTALLAAADLSGHVLEVGCGDGRLARRYAPVSRLVVGLDQDHERLVSALRAGASHNSLRFLRGSLPLPLRDEAFDVALFGWSL